MDFYRIFIQKRIIREFSKKFNQKSVSTKCLNRKSTVHNFTKPITRVFPRTKNKVTHGPCVILFYSKEENKPNFLGITPYTYFQEWDHP